MHFKPFKNHLVTVMILGMVFVGGHPFGFAAEQGAQEQFATPEAAVDALTKALKNNDEASLLAIFGPDSAELVMGTDKAAARADRKRAYADLQTMHSLQEQGDNLRVLIIGKKAWPFPIPIVRENKGWHFDTAAGKEEMLNRRIGQNELHAIETLRAYVEAQQEYASEDRNGDQVLEYAQKISSSPGKKDGLYWKVEPGSDDELSPFGPFVADATDYLEGRKPGDPFKGYYFKILVRQGNNPPGGRYDYIINGHMIGGFAMVAMPADYGSSGIMTFVVNQQGKVFEKDLGKNTRDRVNAMQEYNSDQTWTEVLE